MKFHVLWSGSIADIRVSSHVSRCRIFGEGNGNRMGLPVSIILAVLHDNAYITELYETLAKENVIK
jgi:hypothetical protein